MEVDVDKALARAIAQLALQQKPHESLRAALGGDFDPEGSGYDSKTAEALIAKYPLTIPKPTSYQGDYVRDLNGAFQAWTWHPELNDYKIHSSSRVPEGIAEGMILKGRKYPTYWMTEKAEEEGNYEIFKSPASGGRYFSRQRRGKGF